VKIPPPPLNPKPYDYSITSVDWRLIGNQVTGRLLELMFQKEVRYDTFGRARMLYLPRIH
jgi:hypothetical protein